MRSPPCVLDRLALQKLARNECQRVKRNTTLNASAGAVTLIATAVYDNKCAFCMSTWLLSHWSSATLPPTYA